MYFLNRNTHTALFIKDSNIPAFPDKISLRKLYFYKELFSSKPYQHWFSFSTDSHTHNTRWSNLDCLKSPPNNSWKTICSHYRNLYLELFTKDLQKYYILSALFI